MLWCRGVYLNPFFPKFILRMAGMYIFILRISRLHPCGSILSILTIHKPFQPTLKSLSLYHTIWLSLFCIWSFFGPLITFFCEPMCCLLTNLRLFRPILHAHFGPLPALLHSHNFKWSICLHLYKPILTSWAFLCILPFFWSLPVTNCAFFWPIWAHFGPFRLIWTHFD